MATPAAPGTGGRESAGTGPGAGHPVIVAYLPGWPQHAETLIAALRGRLGVLAGRIEHIGSTAIPGMDAKDVLDLQVSVTDLDAAARAFDRPLVALGFERAAYARRTRARPEAGAGARSRPSVDDRPGPIEPRPGSAGSGKSWPGSSGRSRNAERLEQGQPSAEVCSVPGIRVSVQAEPRDLDSWLVLARRLESAGFHALLMGDHPGSGASPWPALGSAAAVTRTLRLGTYVAQAGVREPVHVAADAATLDILAPGRVLLGIGAGHTPREWEDVGRRRPAPGERAGRLIEFVDAVARLLSGETVTREGPCLKLHGSRLESLPAGAGRVKLMVGGGHPAILRAAARRADIVGLSGLGRTLPDGHQHEVRWSAADLQRQLQLVRDEARRAGNAPVIEALVQMVTVTEDKAASIDEISGRIPGASAEDVARTPFLLIGTYEQMATQLLEQAEESGISSYVVREPAIPHIEHVLALLTK